MTELVPRIDADPTAKKSGSEPDSLIFSNKPQLRWGFDEYLLSTTRTYQFYTPLDDKRNYTSGSISTLLPLL